MTARYIEPARPMLPPDWDGRLVTGAELLLHPEWGHCELIEGKVTPLCKPTFRHGNLMHKLSMRLGVYVEQHNLGEIASGDAGIYLERDPDTVRGPDLQFIAASRCPKPLDWTKYLDVAPDLCIEIVSPNDRWINVEKKVNQYLAIGVKLIWIVDPESRSVHVRRIDSPGSIVSPDGTLSGENIIPGFELKLTDLFPKTE